MVFIIIIIIVVDDDESGQELYVLFLKERDTRYNECSFFVSPINDTEFRTIENIQKKLLSSLSFCVCVCACANKQLVTF